MMPPNSGEFDPWFVRIQMEQSTLSRVEKSWKIFGFLVMQSVEPTRLLSLLFLIQLRH